MTTKMPNSYLLGCDPGADGAVAIFALSPTPKPVAVIDLRDGIPHLINSLAYYAPSCQLAMIERVHSMPNDGKASAFTFGFNAGLLEGVLMSFNINIQKTPPVVWKSILGLKGASKDDSIALAKKLYGDHAAQFLTLKRHHNRAEAILLAHFGLRFLKLTAI